jgi:integrase
MKRLMRIIKWGVSKGMVPASVHQTLKCIDPLKRGRCGAPEAEPIKPVSRAAIDATLPHLTQVVADMVRVQLLLGCRPGEICKLTPCMIVRDKTVWQIQLEEHKTAYRGKSRVIFAGPKAQAILKKYLLRGPDDPLFSPIESERQRREAAHADRVTPMNEGDRPGKNRKKNPRKAPRTAFDTQSYSKSILYATRKAKIDPWSANQLRHTRATEIRSQFGLEAAASILGHSEIGVTQVYAEADMQRAIEVAHKTG